MANWNYFQWVCMTLVISAHSGGYRHDSRTELFLYPDEFEATEEPKTYYRQVSSQITYSSWARTRARHNAQRREGVSARSIAEDSSRNEDLNSENRQRSATTPSRSGPRTENGTFKIINIVPASHQNQRDSKDEAPPVGLRDSIVFPSEPAPAAKADRKSFSPLVTESCKQGHTLCLSVPNYPENYITNLLSNSAEDVQSQLSVDELEQVKISQRIGEDPDEFELCTFHERVVYPQAAQNKESKWLMIINQQNYKQGFRVELCYKENSACSPAATFRLGMEASCKQKYVLRRMTAVDDNGQVVTDHFRLPSCCSCVVRYADVFSDRQRRDNREREP